MIDINNIPNIVIVMSLIRIEYIELLWTLIKYIKCALYIEYTWANEIMFEEEQINEII